MRTGIPEFIKSQIFNPFFTTKSNSDGFGLGISVVHDIVQKIIMEKSKSLTILQEEQFYYYNIYRKLKIMNWTRKKYLL